MLEKLGVKGGLFDWFEPEDMIVCSNSTWIFNINNHSLIWISEFFVRSFHHFTKVLPSATILLFSKS